MGETMNTQPKMIFWHYDQFPYCLSGLGEILPSGLAYVPSYRSSFKPFLVLDIDEGKKMKAKRDALQAEYDEARKTLRAGFNARLRDICPETLEKKET
jgi:hypothetical protein